MIRQVCLALALTAAPYSAAAHGLVVFASANCDDVVVEAKFSNGKAALVGELRILDGNNDPLLTQDLAPDEDGVSRFSLGELDTSNGLVIEVDTGNHDNYWIMTPEDIARSCGS